MVLGNGDTAIAELLRMQRLRHHAFVQALAADARIQHVAGQEVDEIHGAFPVSERAGRLAEHIAFEYRKFFGIMFELFELRTDESR